MTPQDQEDFLDAIKNLTDRQKLTLYNFSAKLLEGTRYCCGMDLLSEVVDRVLSGSRAWRRSVPIGAFLYKAMLSVASVDRRRASHRPLSWEDWMERGADAIGEAENDFARSPEEALIARQEAAERRAILDEAEKRLAANKDALAVFRGLSSDLSPAEIREVHGLTELVYKAARAQIAKEARAVRSRPRR